jgi:hypothetical protein
MKRKCATSNEEIVKYVNVGSNEEKEEDTTIAPITKLPNELLTSIFDLLENKVLIHTINFVNKHWRNIMLQPCVWRGRTIDVDNVSLETIVPFLKHCDISKLSVRSSQFLNQILPQFSTIVTSLGIGYVVDVRRNNVEQLAFPELQCLIFHSRSYDTEVLVNWLKAMPKITSLSVTIHSANILDQIMLTTSLRKLALYYLLSEEEVIRIFKQLTLLDDVQLEFNNTVTSSVWNKIFEIEGLSDRLKSLDIRQIISSPQVSNLSSNNSFNFTLKNLKCLNIDSRAKSHLNLLYCCSQNSLEQLSIKLPIEFSWETLEERPIHFPKLKRVILINVSYSYALHLLQSCSNTIEYLQITVLPDEYTPVHLNFPNIRSISCIDRSAAFCTQLFANIAGYSVRKFSLNVETLTNPEIILLKNIISKLVNVTDLNVPHGLLENGLDTILSCRFLVTFGASGSGVVTNNWLKRMLNCCIYLDTINIDVKAIISTKLDLTDLQTHQFLRDLTIDYSSVHGKFDLLLKNLPNLNCLSCFTPLDGYSHIIENLNRYPVPHLRIILTRSDSIVFDRCQFLTNSKVQTVFFAIVSNITFSQCLLAALCIGFVTKSFRFLISVRLNKSTFMGQDYNGLLDTDNLDTRREIIASIQNRLIKQVVPTIDGISDEQREILNSLTTENNKLMNDIYQSLVNTFAS